jgi:hypothetical protein
MKTTASWYNRRKLWMIVQVILIFFGFSQLLLSDAYFTPYFLISISSFLCLYLNSKTNIDLSTPHKWTIGLTSLLFVSMIVLANYPIWAVGGIRKTITFAIIFIGVFTGFWQIFKWVVSHINQLSWKFANVSWRPHRVFCIVFVIISTLNSLVLFLSKYPGILTTDSIVQINQIFSNTYSNHHPFLHTMIIRMCISIGTMLFHDINAGVALYSVISILFMAATFALTVATLAEIKVNRWLLVCTSAFFILMPYHIIYSVTMWKDVPFGAFVLLFYVFFFRIVCRLSLMPFNWFGFVISSIGFCLFRSNGLFAFVFTTLCFFILWKLKYKKMLFIMIGIVIASLIIKNPVYDALNVAQTDVVESLSIPVQQISRVIVEGEELTNEERELLNKIVDIDKIEQTYNPWISDPMKQLIRAKGNVEYINEHSTSFIKLYFQLLFRYPGSFVRGWVDQTRGYWNSGYSYWRWTNDLFKNDHGIFRTVQSESAARIIDNYLSIYTAIPALHIFISIGFFNWMVLGALFISIIRKDKVGAMMSIPIIMIVLSLLVATPVYSEFRYMYAVFCALPFILAVVLRPESMVENKEVSNG